jgi:hypothetical protein
MRKTTLQEKMESAAVQLEKEPRYVVQQNSLRIECRERNKALLGRSNVTLKVMLNKLPATKLQEYDKYPLASQLGFIQYLPEEEFDIHSATITEVGYLGLSPKRLVQILHEYTRGIQ